MSINLRELNDKKLRLGLRKLGTLIGVEDWLAMCDADQFVMQHLADAWPKLLPSFTYDAIEILGFGEASKTRLPKPKPGECVIRVGEWTYEELLNCPFAERFMRRQRATIKSASRRHWWPKRRLEPGIYRVRLPMPLSNNKAMKQQTQMLREGEFIAPAVLCGAVLLCQAVKGGERLLEENHYCRCEGSTILPHGNSASFSINENGQIFLGSTFSNWDLSKNVWAASAQIVERFDRGYRPA